MVRSYYRLVWKKFNMVMNNFKIYSYNDVAFQSCNECYFRSELHPEINSTSCLTRGNKLTGLPYTNMSCCVVNTWFTDLNRVMLPTRESASLYVIKLVMNNKPDRLHIAKINIKDNKL